MINQYIPKVIVAGDKEAFIATISSANKPVKVIGSISFTGEIDNKKYNLAEGTIRFDDKIIKIEELKKMSDEGNLIILYLLIIYILTYLQ